MEFTVAYIGQYCPISRTLDDHWFLKPTTSEIFPANRAGRK